MRIPISMADPAIVQEMGSKRDPMLSSNNPTRVKIAPGKQVMLQDWQSSRPTVICTCSLLCRAYAGSLMHIIQYHYLTLCIVIGIYTDICTRNNPVRVGLRTEKFLELVTSGDKEKNPKFLILKLRE